MAEPMEDVEDRGSRECDMTHAARKLWLVKVPMGMARAWEAADDNADLGRLRVYANGRVEMQVDQKVVDAASKLTDAPMPSVLEFKAHKEFPPMAILSDGQQDGFAVEGSIESKYDARFQQGAAYDALQEVRKVRADTHRETQLTSSSKQYRFKAPSGAKQLKNINKAVRRPEQEVKEQLFGLFAKHEFYRLENLARLTNQPKTYLREILGEIAILNKTNPHKNMWHLKADFKHF